MISQQNNVKLAGRCLFLDYNFTFEHPEILPLE